MKRISYPKFIIGFTDTETVMLDLDHMPFEKVKYWTRKALRFFKLQGLLILESSENCYHVIFDKIVSWSENLSIIGRIVLIAHHRLLRKWHLVQCIKQSMTVRVSPKGDKPSPRIVYREGNQDGQIKDFLLYRRMIKRILRKLPVRALLRVDVLNNGC